MRERPRLQPMMSLALLVQVGAMPGWPGASQSQSRARSATTAGGHRPQLEAALEGVLVVTETGIARKFLQERGVAAAEDHVVRLEGRLHALDHGRNIDPPFPGSEPFEAGAA